MHKLQSKPHCRFYAGIGSRETPRHIQDKMTSIAEKISKSFCLLSGGADGADAAFEKGAKHKQIFLPWDGFNGRFVDNDQYFVPPLNLDLVKKYHPKFASLSDACKKLMSRNSYQVLGPTLDTPVEFVLCWTKDGKASGGTGQAIRIAESRNIPVFNFQRGFEDFSRYMVMESFLK